MKMGFIRKQTWTRVCLVSGTPPGQDPPLHLSSTQPGLLWLQGEWDAGRSPCLCMDFRSKGKSAVNRPHSGLREPFLCPPRRGRP